MSNEDIKTLFEEAYDIYKNKAIEHCELMQESYLRKYLLAKYIRYQDYHQYQDNIETIYNKVVEETADFDYLFKGASLSQGN